MCLTRELNYVSLDIYIHDFYYCLRTLELMDIYVICTFTECEEHKSELLTFNVETKISYERFTIKFVNLHAQICIKELYTPSHTVQCISLI